MYLEYKAFSRTYFMLLKKHYVFIIGLVVFLLLILFMEIMLMEIIGEKDILFMMLLFFINSLLHFGMLNIAFKMVHLKSFDYTTIFATNGMLFYFIITSFLYNIIVSLGIIFLILPGIYFSIRFMFYGFFIIEKHSSPIEALKKSFLFTRGYETKIFVIQLIFYLLNFLAFYFTYIGIVLTIPLTLISQALLYVYIKRLYEIQKSYNEYIYGPFDFIDTFFKHKEDRDKG